METKVKKQLIDYKNDNLIDLFLAREGQKYTREQAIMLFDELKKLLFVLYLVQAKKAPFGFFLLTTELDPIDKLWHQFILMTSEYAKFCNDICDGVFIHHQPNLETVGEDINYFEQVKDQIYFLEKIWGSHTVVKWYYEIPKMLQPINKFWSRLWKTVGA